MFINSQNSNNIEYYVKLLKAAGSLSSLFSESDKPFLYYRYVENLFCKSFSADNLSRSDVSVDASKNKLGIGIKTFLYKNGQSFEKIAEFNKSSNLFRNLEIDNLVKKVSELRNERIDATNRIFNLESTIYHCVVRRVNGILIYEAPLEKVDINKINKVTIKGNIINFTDNKEAYQFNISKNTLYKRFNANEVYRDFEVKFISDPFKELEKIIDDIKEIVFSSIREQEHIFLPLYSYDKKNGDKVLYEKSGLNQWNAGGRPRDLGEVYIPIPAWIHEAYKSFFPDRDVKFNIKLPNNKILVAKLCQDNAKALMSDPNNDLGEWLLRDVLSLKEGELLTYKKLEEIGIDSVVIYKNNSNMYDIDFTKIGSYEEFKDGINNNQEE